MFYEGDLQSGIGLAMQEAKLVGCFVTGRDDYMPHHVLVYRTDDCVASDDGEESQLWENEFLQDGSVSLRIVVIHIRCELCSDI